MLVQIPSTSDAIDDRGRLYKVFNIYIGGHYHCSLRYSHLLHFSQELGRNFDTSGLDEFPTKRVFSLTTAQLDERRAGLERYLHSVCQDRVMQQSDMLKEFLVAAQKASSGVTDEDVTMEIFLINGKSVTVSAQSFSRSDEVLEKAVVKIGVDPSHTYYLSLFLEEQTGDSWTLYRHLQDHEAPFVSLRTVNVQDFFRITIRMSFWEPEMVSGLLDDEAATNMLYIEILDHISNGEWEVGREVKEKLADLRDKGLKKQYVEAAATIAQFGYRQMDGLTFDHPSDNLHGFARIGRKEIATYTTEGEGEWGGSQGHGVRCRSYQLTRIRCWKVGYWESGDKWLSFHYHHGDTDEDFVWVRLVGKATIFLTLCIQSAVNELIRVRKKQSLRLPSDGTQRRKTALPIVKFHVPSQTRASRRESEASQGSEVTDGPTLSEEVNGEAERGELQVVGALSGMDLDTKTATVKFSKTSDENSSFDETEDDI